MRARLLCAFGIAALTAAAPAAFGQTGSRQDAKIVKIDFDPRVMSVTQGTTITWTNTDERPHTVSDRGGTFDTDVVAPKATASVTFSVPGRYAFFCRINPGKMNGVIEVKPSGDAPVVRVQGTDPARVGAQLSYDPAELTVRTGTIVVFANVGGKPHTLTADDGSFDTGVVVPGAEGGKFAGTNASIAANAPGRFPFHCEVHPAAMKGVLNVQGEAKQAPGGASGAPRDVKVDMVDFAFKGNEVSVAPGGSVTWRNKGSAQHSATFDDIELDSDTIESGNEAKVSAPIKPGSYSYRCAIHPARMRGVLVVVGQNVADPTKVNLAAAAAPSGGGGPGGGVSSLALGTGVLGAFLGGFGISAFVRNTKPA